jgi:type II secretory pathway component PulF
MADDISKGFPLSRAFSRYPHIFGTDVRSLVRVGENSGTLDISLEKLARSLERDTALRGQVISALTYPVLVACFCFVGCMLAPPLFLNDFFHTLQEAHSNLPWLTTVVMHLSALLWHPATWVTAGLSVAALPFLRRSFFKRPNLVKAFENFVLEIPVLGEVVKDLVVLKFVRALGLQLEAGLYLDQALKLSAESSGSLALAEETDRVVARLLGGESLGFALGRSDFFPPDLVEFVRVGEETGKLGEMCTVVESLLTQKTEYSIEVGKALVEPAAMACVGILVGTVALACLLPIVKMVQNFL